MDRDTMKAYGNKLALIVASFLLVFSATFGTNTGKSSALSGSNFQAGRIMDDPVFFNKNKMSTSQIQAFLNAKVPVCDTNGSKPYAGTTRAAYGTSHGYPPPYTCLKDYRQTTTSKPPESGICDGHAAGTKSAAQIIYEVAQSCGVNPQVLIVLLQKEQSLVTDDWPWSIQYRSATGYGCPDSAPCDSEYYGFFNQVYNAARIFKYYAKNPTSFNYRAGRNNTILWHPNTSCGSSTVFIQNQATAGLYNYTPYRPNAAALNNLYGTGDGCSSYGNRNFWRMFNDWFGNPLGSPFFRLGKADNVYVLGSNNNYYRVPDWSTLYSYGYGKTVSSIVSVTNSHVSGKTFSGDLPPLARFEGDEIYLMDDGRAHHFTSREMLESYGYAIGQEAYLPTWGLFYTPQSTNMENVVEQSDGDPVYYVDGGKKRHITDGEAFATGSPAYNTRPRVKLHSRFLVTIPSGAPILTANKLLKRVDTNTYGFWNGSQLQDISTQTINELKPTIDYASSAVSINQLAAAPTSVNKLVKSSGGQLYIFDAAKKLSVSPSDLTDLGLASGDFITTSDNFLSRVSTQAFSKITKVDGGNPVYLYDGAERQQFMSPAAVYENGYTMSGLKSILGSTAAALPNSGSVLLASGQLFRIGSASEVYVVNDSDAKLHVPSRTLLDEYGYGMGSVLSFSSGQVSPYVTGGTLAHIIKDTLGNVWMIDGGGRRHALSATMQNSSNYNITVSGLETVSQAFISSLSSSYNLTGLVQVPGDPKVYKVEGGQKRWVTSRSVFESSGYSWDGISGVSASFLGSLPPGPQI